MSRNVVVLQRILPHYRLPIFERLRERESGLRVVYGQSAVGEAMKSLQRPELDWLEKVSNYYLSTRSLAYATNLWGRIPKDSVVLVNAELGNLNLPVLFAFRRLLGLRIVLWTFGYDPALGFDPSARSKDRMRRWMYENADATVFYWEQGKREIENVIGKRDSFFVAPNTLDTDAEVAIRAVFASRPREELLQKAGLNEGRHFCFVGRLIADKEVDRLLTAWKAVEAARDDAHLSVVGDGPELPALRDLAIRLDLRRCTFMGAITDRERVGLLLYLSDALVMPGRLGLSVVHAFCYGTPVVSQLKGLHFHGEGVGYLTDGANGFLVPDGDVVALSSRVIEICRDRETRERLRRGATGTIEQRASISLMIDGLQRGIQHASH